MCAEHQYQQSMREKFEEAKGNQLKGNEKFQRCRAKHPFHFSQPQLIQNNSKRAKKRFLVKNA